MGEMAVNFVFLSGKNSFYSGRMYIRWGQKGKEGVSSKGRGCSHQYVNAGVITTLPQRKTSRLCLSWENIPSPVNAFVIIEGDFFSCSQKMTIGDKIGIGLVADWLRFPKIARSSGPPPIISSHNCSIHSPPPL